MMSSLGASPAAWERNPARWTSASSPTGETYLRVRSDVEDRLAVVVSTLV